MEDFFARMDDVGGDIKIRRAKADDFGALCRIEYGNGALCYSDDMIKSLLEDGSVVFVAEAATRSTKAAQPINETAEQSVRSKILKAETESLVVGYVAVSIVFEDADIINIAVEKEWRCCGIGALLISNVVCECVRLGAKRVLLEVSESNTSAIRFYRGLGFEQISLRPRYYGEFSAIIMQLSLTK